MSEQQTTKWEPTEWEVVNVKTGVRSYFSPGTFPSEAEALRALSAREMYPELWQVRPVAPDAAPVTMQSFSRSYF
jgi:hypothetical protein